MTARSLRDVYDDCNTLVMPTRPPPHANSYVIPVERYHDGREGAGGQPIRSGARAVRNDVPAPIARSRADERTRPSLRYTSELQRYRRLSLMLAVSLAFVLGVTASLAAQLSAHFTPAATRTPRDGITRGEWLSIVDGVETKAAPRARPRRLVPRSPPPAQPTFASTSAPASASTSAPDSASTSAPASASTSAPTESMAPSSASPDDGPSDLVGRDLLREGLSAD